MKRWIITSLLVFGMMMTACEGDNPLAPDQMLTVIRAYIYAGEPVQDIQITESVALGSDSLVAPPVNDAEVWLLQNGQEFVLSLSLGDSGYYHYAGDDLVIQTGDELELRVLVDGEMVHATTVVPPAPENVVLSKDSLIIEAFVYGSGMGMGQGMGMPPIKVLMEVEIPNAMKVILTGFRVALII